MWRITAAIHMQQHAAPTLIVNPPPRQWFPLSALIVGVGGRNDLLSFPDFLLCFPDYLLCLSGSGKEQGVAHNDTAIKLEATTGRTQHGG
jgi:hypothetical protein